MSIRSSLLALSLLAAPPALAVEVDPPDEKEEEDKDPAAKLTYSGLGFAQVESGFDNVAKAVNLGGVMGVRIPGLSFLAAELDISTSIIPGENVTPSGGLGGGGGGGGSPCLLTVPILFPPGCDPAAKNGVVGSKAATRDRDDFGVTTLALYAVLRTNPEWLNNFYGIGRIGYGYLMQSSIEELADDGQTGTALGAGAGYRYRLGETTGGVEVLFTKFNDQLDYTSLNITYGFD